MHPTRQLLQLNQTLQLLYLDPHLNDLLLEMLTTAHLQQWTQQLIEPDHLHHHMHISPPDIPTHQLTKAKQTISTNQIKLFKSVRD